MSEAVTLTRLQESDILYHQGPEQAEPGRRDGRKTPVWKSLIDVAEKMRQTEADASWNQKST
jgi:hypothetical protein